MKSLQVPTTRLDVRRSVVGHGLTYKQAEMAGNVLLGLVALAVIIDISAFFYIASNGLVGKMWNVVWHNFQFPIVLTILGSYGLYWRRKDPAKFSPVKLVGYFAVLPFVAFPLAAVSYFVATDLHDIEIWNGRVTKVVYEEQWQELVTYPVTSCSGSGKDQSCTTRMESRIDYHPPSWHLVTSNGEDVSTSGDVYSTYVNHFGNQVFVSQIHPGQVSFGDGNMYYTSWKGESEKMIPTAVEHPFINYLRASQSITKVQGAVGPYTELLVPYPRVGLGRFGNINANRVIVARSPVSSEWVSRVNDGLSRMLAVLGSEKQVNAIVYIANADIGFFQALKEFWTDGKKNDVIVVIGSKDGHTIDWVQVQAWTKIELFKIRLADEIRDLKMLDSNEDKIVGVMTENIRKPASDGGFQRMPMAELEYLLAEIHLPLWATFLMIVLNILVVSPIIFYIIKK